MSPCTKFGSSGPCLILLCAGFLSMLSLGCDEDTPLEPPVASTDSYRVSLNKSTWYKASPPLSPQPGGPPDTLSAADRGDYVWYNIEPDFGPWRRDLWPNLDSGQNSLVAALDIEPDLPMPVSGDVWMGIMRGFTNRDGLDVKKYEYLDIWVNDFKPDPQDRGGFLHIDLGLIDEDFFEPDLNELNDEDRNGDGFFPCDDDTGLDNRFNMLPRHVDPDDPTLPDPPDEGGLNEDDDVVGDDYEPRRIEGRFSKVNGTEGNFRYDTEDLNHSGYLDEANCYFSYVIDLANDIPIRDVRAEFPNHDRFDHPYHSNDSWRKYRIPLNSGVPVGSCLPARLKNVHHIRIWFSDVSTVINQDDWRRTQIAEIRFAN